MARNKKTFYSLFICILSLFISSLAAAGTKIHVNGIDVYYELQGQGKPIVLIAGFSCDHSFWSGIVTELAKHHQVLSFDNRGVGQTDAPDKATTVDLMADDAMALIKVLKLKKPSLIGQSLGSAIAQAMARRSGKDFDKIVLINTFDKLNKAPLVAFELTGDLQAINTPLKYRAQSIIPWSFSSDFLMQKDQVTKLIKMIEGNPHPQSAVGYQRQLEALKAFDSRIWLREIKNPTLVIAAQEDIIAPLAGSYEVVNEIGGKTQLLLVPGGHASPIEQPQKITQAILEFVK